MLLAACNSSQYDQRLRAGPNRLRQWRIRRLMCQILLTREEAQKRPSLQRDMIANRPTQHGIARLDRIEHRAQRDEAFDFYLQLSAHARQGSQMWREDNAHHENVLIPASAPPHSTLPANPAQSDSSYLRHRPTH